MERRVRVLRGLADDAFKGVPVAERADSQRNSWRACSGDIFRTFLTAISTVLIPDTLVEK
jgi:hypothetical protein